MSYSVRRAFTLIELAIVLVVVGLIIASIVVGRGLIRQAQLRTLTSDFVTYSSAINSFRAQYSAWPGDIANATSYWGTALNGNGNQSIDDTAAAVNEGIKVWQHLALAGLIPGSYTGTNTAGITNGVNVPSSTIHPRGMYYLWDIGSVGQAINNRKGNAIHAGKTYTAGNTSAMGSILTPSEAQSVDLKIDDGVANTGQLHATSGNDSVSGCNTGNQLGGGDFTNLTVTTLECRLWFWLETKR